MKIIDTLTKSSEFHEPSEKPFVRMSPQSIEYRDKLNEMIAAGKIAFEEVPCLCGGATFSLISKYDRFGVRQNTVICTQCGLVQSNPRMTKEATDWFYGSDFYGNLYGRIGGKATREFILSESEKRPRARYEFIKQSVNYDSVKSVLEIGCAGGWSLYPFFKDGKKVVGYDYGPALVEAGKKLGMDLRVGTIENDKTNSEKYDLILMNHLFEHLLNPVQFLKFLDTHLSPGGHIFIEIPDMKELSIGGLVNAHAYYFTKDTFFHYVGTAGFSPVAYQNDKRELSSQNAIFERAAEGFVPPPLSHEYERMKKIIMRDDKRLQRRQSLKSLSYKIGMGKITAYAAHIGRKIMKRSPKLETAFSKKD